MVHFKVRGQTKVLTTNFKVMYRTLCFHKNLRQISIFELIIIRAVCWIIHKEFKHTLLVRNPYFRIISFFQDKFIFNPVRGRQNRSFRQWQDSQRLFFPYLNISSKDTHGVVAKKLMSFKFDDFIKILPKLYQLDPHILPQSQIKFFNLTITLPLYLFSQVIKLEDADKMQFLANEFEIDLRIKENSTSESKIEQYFNKQTIELFNQIYKEDFNLFDYKQINSVNM